MENRKRMRMSWEVHIREAVNGFVVNGGCSGPIVFADWESLKTELNSLYTGKTTALLKELLDSGGLDCGEAAPVPKRPQY